MVKLEVLDGMPEWVNPSSVVRVAGIPESWESRNIKSVGASVYLSDGKSINCKGTPDEVHAKLFPELSMSAQSVIAESERASQYAVQVLERIADADAGSPVSIHAILLARKALGREGA